MAKQLLVSERPGEIGGSLGLGDGRGNPLGGGGDSMPKGSIGNYKGVMLCNRPNEMQGFSKGDRDGPVPFVSRVDPKESLGINPTKKFGPQRTRKSKTISK